ncbi:branched-chain amino acid ABC transporter permease [Haloprofundus marisrubri]|uniref:Branched-chain amino acid ABC transporter permease n=1 Tax=Haloprofundus marisrubri TaxID=1514971 RepID=A0A0W1R6U6_9EURY|nr:AzlC family ABC transporter permease [Haloprofundus marisrubri]KTG09112.1 branched-chain amino acid ABC transporter permease [Haloprofundus marisrubri]
MNVPTELRAGIRDAVPLFLGIVPFAVVFGVAAVDAGLSAAQAVGLSVFVFAGASQLATLDLLARDAAIPVVVLTAVVINLRMLMYSASIAPYFRSLAGRTKAFLAYLLTDQAYALSVAHYGPLDRTEAASTSDDRHVDENNREPDVERRERNATNQTTNTLSAADRRWYYLGVAASLWAVWQVGTVAGLVVGTGVPESWGLEFTVPLVFLALLVPAMKDVPTTAAGAVGGVVAVVTAGLPLNLGLLVGATVGIVAGLVAERGRQ